MADERYVLQIPRFREQGPLLEDGPCTACRDGTLVSEHGDRGRAGRCGQCGIRAGEHDRLVGLGEITSHDRFYLPHDPRPPRGEDLAVMVEGDTFTAEEYEASPFTDDLKAMVKRGWVRKQIKQSGRWVDSKGNRPPRRVSA